MPVNGKFFDHQPTRALAAGQRREKGVEKANTTNTIAPILNAIDISPAKMFSESQRFFTYCIPCLHCRDFVSRCELPRPGVQLCPIQCKYAHSQNDGVIMHDGDDSI